MLLCCGAGNKRAFAFPVKPEPFLSTALAAGMAGNIVYTIGLMFPYKTALPALMTVRRWVVRTRAAEQCGKQVVDRMAVAVTVRTWTASVVGTARAAAFRTEAAMIIGAPPLRNACPRIRRVFRCF